MIIGYEMGEVSVYENLDAVMAEWAKYYMHVITEEILFFDNDGTWLEPIEIYAPRTWYRWFKKTRAVQLV